MKHIAALIACHNHKVETLVCLDALFNNDLPEGYPLEVFLVDDGSTDGTKYAKQWRWGMDGIANANK